MLLKKGNLNDLTMFTDHFGNHCLFNALRSLVDFLSTQPQASRSFQGLWKKPKALRDPLTWEIRYWTYGTFHAHWIGFTRPPRMKLQVWPDETTLNDIPRLGNRSRQIQPCAPGRMNCLLWMDICGRNEWYYNPFPFRPGSLISLCVTEPRQISQKGNLSIDQPEYRARVDIALIMLIQNMSTGTPTINMFRGTPYHKHVQRYTLP